MEHCTTLPVWQVCVSWFLQYLGHLDWSDIPKLPSCSCTAQWYRFPWQILVQFHLRHFQLPAPNTTLISTIKFISVVLALSDSLLLVSPCAQSWLFSNLTRHWNTVVSEEAYQHQAVGHTWTCSEATFHSANAWLLRTTLEPNVLLDIDIAAALSKILTSFAQYSKQILKISRSSTQEILIK